MGRPVKEQGPRPKTRSFMATERRYQPLRRINTDPFRRTPSWRPGGPRGPRPPELPPLKPVQPVKPGVAQSAKLGAPQIGGLVRKLGYVGVALGLADQAEMLYQRYANPMNPLAPPPGWTLYKECFNYIRQPFMGFKHVSSSPSFPPTANELLCIDGQAGTWPIYPQVIPANRRWFSVGQSYIQPVTNVVRLATWRWYSRPAVGTAPQTVFSEPTLYSDPWVDFGPRVGPNTLREMPGEAPTAEPYEYWLPPVYYPYFDTEIPELSPEFDPVRVPWRGIAIGTGPGAGAEALPMPKLDPHKRAPVKAPDKEAKKALTRAARVAIAIFNKLDTISELSEIVDEVYNAVPWKKRRQWEEDHGYGNWYYDRKEGRRKWYTYHRPGVDSFGQLGINGADWKLYALRDMYKDIDTVDAWKGIAFNLLEDHIYGGLYKRLPGQGRSNAFNENVREVAGSFSEELEAFLK